MHDALTAALDQAASYVLKELKHEEGTGGEGRGLAAIYGFAHAFTDTDAQRLQLGSNIRYLTAKAFSFVLPTRGLVNWLCDQVGPDPPRPPIRE